MRTTIDMPDALYREAKARAAMEGLSLKDLLVHSIEAHLYGQPAELRSVDMSWQKEFELVSAQLSKSAKQSQLSAVAQLKADRSRLD